jgi:hypothetical protein
VYPNLNISQNVKSLHAIANRSPSLISRLMANIQSQMMQFHEAIKLKRFEENATLCEKRQIILDRLDAGLKKLFASKNLQPPSYEKFDQGSYAMGTGVKPLGGNYDIDVGICFKIAKADYPDPVKVKEWVLEALNNLTSCVEIRRPCVTVFYQRDGEAIYHVDLAIYSDSECNPDGKMYLAKGKQNSSSEYRVWQEADPQGLMELIKNHFQDSEDEKQFRRIIRYLKRWKDLKFSSDGNAAPIGIGITVAAYYWFVLKRSIDPFNSQRQYDDLDALGCFVQVMISHFQPKYADGTRYERLEVKLPVAPDCDLFEQMTDSQMTAFKEKLVALLNTIHEAQKKADPIGACKLLHEEQFRDDFPVPDRPSTGQQRPPAIVSSSSSA